MREGEYARDRIPVTGHVLDIPARVKELDDALFIMLNRRTQRFEIWREEWGRGILECVLPYDALDGRTVEHVRRHRVERMNELIREMEEHNRRLEEDAKRDWLDKAGERTREAIKYLKNRVDTDEVTEAMAAG